ncbi:MAG: choice-of-anchor D domain-containing protein [Rhodobacteraceae bacterium]|nr:choice-of-anchor D domain-containing protein [Paracoccaceae bacterium]
MNGVYSATLTFSEPVTGLTESDLALVNASASLSGSGDSYALEITPDGDGLLSVTVPAEVAEDGAGNGNTASVTREATFDGTAPTFTLGDLVGPQNGNQFTSRVTFSEPVTGFAFADLALTNATAELTPVSSTVYDIVLTAQAAGDTGYGIGAGAVEDAAGNANTATGSKSIAYGGLPGIELRGDGSLIPPDSADTETGNGTDMGTHEFPQGTTRQFTISNPGTASLTLSQISDDDDNFSASAASMSIAPGESTTLTVTFAPVETGSHSATVEITSDAYGQASYSFEVSAVSQDTTAPETSLAALTGPVSGTYTTTISFSEDVTGFTGDDLQLVNATASVSGSGDSYTVTLTPSGQGTVSVSAPAGMTEDASGNPSTADGPVSAVYDTVPPQVTISELAGPTSGIYTVTVTFSEPVTGLTEQDLNVVNATADLTGSGTDYVIKLSPLADGLVSLSIPADAAQDAAGNGNVASQTRQATHDTTGPSADLSPLSGPVDGVYTASLTFSEPVSGLSESGLSLVNATASVTGSGQDYTIAVTPSGPGLFSVQVQANAATDQALNGNTASVTRSAMYDGIAPTVQLNTDAESYSGPEDLSVTVTFSEPVTGFGTDDVQISGGSVTGLTGSGADYLLSVRSSGTGDLSVQLPEGAAEDGAGNLSEASNLLSLANTVVEESREAIAQFLIQRNAALLASQPDLTALLSGNGTPRSFALQARPGMLSFSFDGALSRSVWMELEARRSTSDGTRSDYLFGVIGAHAIASERLVAGVMLQFDHMATSAADPAIEGSGWLAGPYVAGQIADHPLRYEARLLYGQTRNRITVGGAPEARFSTERWLAQARLEGSVERGIYRLEPSVGIAHVQDRQAAYSDGFGNPVAGQSAALTEVDLGLDVSWPVETPTGALEMTGGVAVVWGKTHTENAPTTGDYDIDGLRGRLTFGLSGQTHDGMTYALGLDYDGLGSDHESFGAKLEVSLRF